MAPFQRGQVATLIHRLAEPPSFIIALFGPRQTGKTTIIRQALSRIDRPWRYLAVDAPDQPTLRFPSAAEETIPPRPQVRDTEWLVRQWEDARRAADRSPRGFVLVLDEIQKISQWSETVKGLWDADRAEDRPLRVVILGSSPLWIQSGLSESLAGRFVLMQVTHWSFSEMAEAFGFDLPAYLYYGGYPGAVSWVREPVQWRDYILRSLVAPNIERDILSMTRVDKPALMRRLFELGAAGSGQILSYNKMLGPLQDAGNTTTLARYLDLLADAGLLAGLPKYAKSPLRRASSPKLNVLNTALWGIHLTGVTHPARSCCGRFLKWPRPQFSARYGFRSPRRTCTTGAILFERAACAVGRHLRLAGVGAQVSAWPAVERARPPSSLTNRWSDSGPRSAQATGSCIPRHARSFWPRPPAGSPSPSVRHRFSVEANAGVSAT